MRELRAGELVPAPQTPGSTRVEVCLEAGKRPPKAKNNNNKGHPNPKSGPEKQNSSTS